MENNQREITPKIYKQELWFFSTTRNLIVLYKCTKCTIVLSVPSFIEITLYDFGVIK